MATIDDIYNKLGQMQGTIQQLTDDQFYANLDISNLNAKITSQGQATMSNSTPIVIASNQTTIPVSLDGAEQTYAASIIGLVPAATPTDIFEISGSATKVIKVRRIRITGVRSASTTSDIVLLKRTTANTGGTSTLPPPVKNDSNNANATAVVKAYTANPTTGTLVGALRSDKQFLNVAGVGSSDVRDYVLTESGAQPLFLRGVAECIAFNLNGVTMAGGLLDIWVEWTEV